MNVTANCLGLWPVPTGLLLQPHTLACVVTAAAAPSGGRTGIRSTMRPVYQMSIDSAQHNRIQSIVNDESRPSRSTQDEAIRVQTAPRGQGPLGHGVS